MFPVLIGLLVAAGAMRGMRPLVGSFAILAVSTLVLANTQVYLAALILNKTVIFANVGERSLWVYPGWFNRLQWATKNVGVQPVDGCGFLALPDMPSLYAIYRAKMPIWEIYALSPKDHEFQEREINRLESCVPEKVILSDHALDGNPEFRYSRMYPLIYEWITSRYELSEIGGTPVDADLRVYSLRR